MPGIYIHIPFCRKACTYCNFHFSTSLGQQDRMVKAIAKEILGWDTGSAGTTVEEPAGEAPLVETIYFGGGTPSLLTADEIERILNAIHSKFKVSTTAEITLETNPDDHSREKLHMWKSSGINRLSIGVQSFVEDDLRWMNRAHDSRQSLNCIVMARNTGFEDLTIDLIYGTPGLTDERWRHNVDTAINLGINHLSCYALTVEPKTRLDLLITKGKVTDIDPEQQSRQFLLLMDWAKAAGFEHYEISNFARPGHRSRHNSAYWQGKPYLGFGPSAHSFDGRNRRWWSLPNNGLYMKAIETGLPFSESELLNPVQRSNEYIMTAIRTVEGLNITDDRLLGTDKTAMNLVLAKWEKTGHLIYEENCIRLTNEGKLFADRIAAELFG